MRHGPIAVALVALLGAGCLTAGGPSPMPSSSPSDSAMPHYQCATAKLFRPINLTGTIETTKGNIGFVLYGHDAPISVCNFLRYVEEGFYAETIWHRICQNFVIQTGGYDPYTPDPVHGDAMGTQKPTHEGIKNEAMASHHRNLKGALGLARESAPDTATSHFFVNLKNNTYLDYDSTDSRVVPGYAVFGNITKGWDVVEAIAATPIIPDAPNMGCNGVPRPDQKTTITSIKIDPV